MERPSLKYKKHKYVYYVFKPVRKTGLSPPSLFFTFA